MDAYILVHKCVTGRGGWGPLKLTSGNRVDSMSVRDDTEIDWKLLPDENWNIWSAHSLQRRWLTMKRSIKGFEEMSHTGQFSIVLENLRTRLTRSAEIMEILKTKKAQSPPPSSSTRKKKGKYLSAEAVTDGDELDVEMQLQSGPSNGPGTIAASED